MSKTPKYIDVEIPNFEKYNPRKDYKSMPWVRIQTDVFFDEKFFACDTRSKALWFFFITFLAGRCSQRGRIDVTMCSHIVKLRSHMLKKCVDELEENQLLIVHSKPWKTGETIAKRSLRNETKRNETNERNGSQIAEASATKVSRISKAKPKPRSKTKELWESYSAAYRNRYGVDPVRNATVNGQLSQIIKRLGEKDSPHVATYFVDLEDSWYCKQGHPVGAFLKDCEKIRTMWATKSRTTVVDDKTAYWQDQHNRIQSGEL